MFVPKGATQATKAPAESTASLMQRSRGSEHRLDSSALKHGFVLQRTTGNHSRLGDATSWAAREPLSPLSNCLRVPASRFERAERSAPPFLQSALSTTPVGAIGQASVRIDADALPTMTRSSSS